MGRRRMEWSKSESGIGYRGYHYIPREQSPGKDTILLQGCTPGDIP
jgi:hypothetical protein